MKLISNKKGRSRERVEAEVDLLSIPNWRIVWSDPIDGKASAKGRQLVLSSRWGSGGDRSFELWLTEDEATSIAKRVVEGLFQDKVAP